MSEPVNGTNIMLYYHDVDTDTDIPFACARTSSFEIQQTFKNVTSYTSAFFTQIKPDVCSWNMGVEGLTILSNYSYLFISDLILARTPILVKYVIDNGTDGLVIYAGSCYPNGLRVTGNYNEASVYSTTLLGTGAFNSTGTQVTPGGIVVEGGATLRYEKTVASENVTISVSELVGVAQVLTVDRGAANVTQIIYTGSPTGGQILVNLSAGTLTASADNPFLAGEEISGLYK